MSKWRNRIILLSAAAVVAAILYQGADERRRDASPRAAAIPGDASGEKPPEKPEIGYSAPSFSLTGLDGKTYDLAALKGKPVILNFWASWCGPCRAEAPSFVKLDELYGDRLRILAVNLTATDSVKSAKQFADEYGFTFPVPLDADGKVGSLYEIRPIPTTIFVDSRGIIADGVLGALTWDDLEERAKALLQPAESES